jgi:DNA-directed RNA polymerase subunit RPC12/RpoP
MQNPTLPTAKIAGKSIKPPDQSLGIQCRHCGKIFSIPKKRVDPRSGKTKLLCPHCGREI